MAMEERSERFESRAAERIPEAGRGEVVYVHSRRGSVPAPGLQLPFSRISWGSIFAGTFVAMSLQMVLSLLGMAIGFGVFTPGQDSPTSLSLGAGIWWSVSAILALFCGGLIAGRLSGSVNKTQGYLHGFVTWGFITVLSAFLVTSAIGGLIGGSARMVSQGAAAVTSGGGGGGGGAVDQLKSSVKEGAQSVQQNAGQVAQQASSGASKAGLVGFIALTLGAISAAIGGRVGVPKDTGLSSSPGSPTTRS